MAHDETIFRLVRHPLRARLLEVTRVENLTPRMRRITFGGADLEGFESLAPEDHVKLFFPRPGEPTPVLPTFGPFGIVLPNVGPKPIGRDYTPRRYDAAAKRLEIDFYLHGHGVASAWAAEARVGQQLGVAGPRGSYVLERAFEWQLFVGDETALPEFARRIEERSAADRVIAVVLVDDAAERQRWPDGVDAHWVHRREGDGASRLADATRALVLPRGEGFAWVAGEAREVREVVRHLVDERGFPRTRIHASGHWKRGVANHDHHEPLDAEPR